jgi:hypothetical protein
MEFEVLFDDGIFFGCVVYICGYVAIADEEEGGSRSEGDGHGVEFWAVPSEVGTEQCACC